MRAFVVFDPGYPPGMGTYLTVAELRAEPEVPDAAPPADAALEQTITTAEDQIDEWLGPWPYQDNGRKIVETDVLDWQWGKLKRATARLAALLYETPTLLQAQLYDEVQGPDFRKKGPRPATTKVAHDVAAPLNASGLRLLSARAGA